LADCLAVRVAAIVAPGYGGSAEQPIVVAMVKRLQAEGITAKAISFSRAKPSGDLTPEIEDVRRARNDLHMERVALVGRSFGGRVCTRLASVEPPPALVLLGHPISPPNGPRPDDEAALAAVRCPTLIIQGENDRLGPLRVLQKLASANEQIEIYVLKGVGHQFGARQAEGIDRAASWLKSQLVSRSDG
jgi:predicted alpha/beta-hydrolase family hydrolase